MTILLDLWAEDSGRRNSKGLNFWPQPSLSEVGLMGRAAFEDFFFFLTLKKPEMILMMLGRVPSPYNPVLH